MRKQSKIALGMLALIVSVFLILQTPLLRHARATAWNTWIAAISRIFGVEHITLTPDLTSQLQQLTSDNVRLRAQQADYLRLKEQLGTPSFESYRTIASEIVARPIDTYHVEYVINRGAKEGVTLDAPVVVYGSTLIGFITDVTERTAVIRLLLHPSTSMAAEVLAENSPRGLLVGRQYTSLTMTTIPRDATVEPGNEVVSVAREGLPAGLLIGKVSALTREEDAAYQEAIISLPYDPDKLRAVSVIVSP